MSDTVLELVKHLSKASMVELNINIKGGSKIRVTRLYQLMLVA